jgi:hypothetical protein
MNYRRFAPIPRENAVALARLHGSGFVPHPEVDEFTLAEILRPSSLPQRQRQRHRSIGFAPAPGNLGGKSPAGVCAWAAPTGRIPIHLRSIKRTPARSPGRHESRAQSPHHPRLADRR